MRVKQLGELLKGLKLDTKVSWLGITVGVKGRYQADETVSFTRAHVAANFRGAICGGAVEEGVEGEFKVGDEGGA